MPDTTLVIGAGISGLIVARELSQLGQKVIVLEKSRGLGGRMATKRIGDGVFDQGTQYFTARQPAFQRLIDEWMQAGVAQRWAGSPHRYVGQPSMTGIAKYLATGLDVRREAKVTAVRRKDALWHVDVDQAEPMIATRLVLTSPVPQSLTVLAQGGVTLPAETSAALAQLTYHSCLALLVLLDGPSDVPFEGVAPATGPLRWVADNGKKGVGPSAPAAVTLHARPDFSAQHYADDHAQVAELLLPAAKRWFGSAREISTTLHRWRYSEPTTQHSAPCIWLPELALGFAGDAFGGPKLEGTVVSGLALAQVLTGAGAGKV